MSDGQQRRNIGNQTGVPQPHEGERDEGADDEDEEQESQEDCQSADDFFEHSSSHVCLMFSFGN